MTSARLAVLVPPVLLLLLLLVVADDADADMVLGLLLFHKRREKVTHGFVEDQLNTIIISPLLLILRD